MSVIVLVAAALVLIVVRLSRTSNQATPRITVAPTNGVTDADGGNGRASFSQPAGFAVSSRFRPSNPLYQPYGGTYLQLASMPNQAQVLAVVIYKLSAATLPTTNAQRLGFVTKVDHRIQAQITRRSTTTVVDGSPAVTQDGTGAARVGGITGNYNYRTFFVFSPPTSLVQITCQWSTERSTVLAGCDQLIGSLDIS